MTSSDQANDEIDLIELLQNIWAGKWVIAGISAVSFAIGGAYINLTPNTFDASIVIRPVDAATSDQFRDLNNTYVQTYIDEAGTSHEELKTYFTAQGALGEFTEVLLQRDTIVQAAIQNDITAISLTDGTALETALRSYAFGVDIVPVTIPATSPTGSTSEVTAWRVTWKADDKAKSDSFIADTLSLTNEVARQRLSQRLSAEVDQIQREQMRRRAQLETEIENAIQDYQVYVNDQLAYLSEQASLARVLEIEFATAIGIGVGTWTGTENSNVAGRSSAMTFSREMTYLDGYRALEEQISILSSREQTEAFVPGLRVLQSELRTLEQNTTADEVVEAIEASPLSDPEMFRAAQYDQASIKITYHKRTNLILTLSFFLGGFVGTVSVLIRNAISARKALK